MHLSTSLVPDYARQAGGALIYFIGARLRAPGGWCTYLLHWCPITRARRVVHLSTSLVPDYARQAGGALIYFVGARLRAPGGWCTYLLHWCPITRARRVVHLSTALVPDYARQAGGALIYFVGARFQGGHGLGSLFDGLLRSAIPLIERGAVALGKRALTSGVRIADEVMSGQYIKKETKRRVTDTGKNMYELVNV